MRKIKKIYFLFHVIFFACFTAQNCYAQVKRDTLTELSMGVEEQLEDITAAKEDVETEDDSYLQEMHHFIKNPINLNYADAGILEELHLLSPIQISNLLTYRKLFGNFIDIYEIQAIPAWDIELIKKIRPFVTVSQKIDLYSSLKKRLKNGERSFLLRETLVLEKAKGYNIDSSMGKNFYPGSRDKILLRYKYRFGNLLQYGITAEKDAGEQFFKGAQKNGFDFYSAHFFIRKLGIIKSLALGDFSINLGQGLVQWQSLAFNKGADLVNVKRQSDVVKPYNSAGEIEFNRGVAVTLQKNNWEATGFASYRKVDASFHNDTLNFEDYVSSLQSSGYHRTRSEIDGRGSQGQLSFGGNISFSSEKWHIGMNGVHYNFENNIIKENYLYNKYALSGKKAGNYSTDYSYTFKNVHFFGEAAIDENLNKAFINGLLVNMDAHVAMSFLYRHISPAYQSLYSNAFTENTFPTNESGFYAGITITPVYFLRIDAYADFFHFPWLKYRTDAPTSGNDYMVQITYKPNKQVELYSRFKNENKPINYNPFNLPFNPVVSRPKQSFRSQFSYKIDNTFTFRSRVELAWFDKRGDAPENGFLVFTDIFYKPSLKKFSGNVRLSYFETGGYNSRMYTFENDVLYAYSIPVFFDKGYRYYLNINYDFTRKLSVWARLAQTIYPEKDIIGSGLDEIKSNKKTEIKLQVIYRF